MNERTLTTLDILDNMARYIDKAAKDQADAPRMLDFLQEDLQKVRSDVLAVVFAETHEDEDAAIDAFGVA